MTTVARGPSHPLTLPAEETTTEIPSNSNKTGELDTPRFSEGSASMDATESGSDSEQLASLTSPKNNEERAAAVFSSGDATTTTTTTTPQTSTTTAGSTSQQQQQSVASLEEQQQLFAMQLQQQQVRQTGGYQGPPRPPRRALFPSQQLGPQGEEQKLPIRPEAEECLFYIHTGWCGYGTSCRYNHPPEKMALHKPKAYNSLGLPLREGVQNCPYFMRMLTCKFAGTCKFNHPQQIIDDAARQQQQQQQLSGAQQQQQQQQMYMQPLMYSPGSSPTHHVSQQQQQLRPRFNSSGSVPSSPVLGPVSAAGGVLPGGAGGGPAFAMPAASPTAYGQPVFVYYVQQPPPTQQEPCLSFMTSGRCQMGYQCPYAHHIHQ